MVPRALLRTLKPRSAFTATAFKEGHGVNGSPVRLASPPNAGCAQQRYFRSSATKLQEDKVEPTADEASKDNDDVVIVEKIPHLHIMTVAINRPEKRNCVDMKTAEKLKAAFLDFEAGFFSKPFF